MPIIIDYEPIAEPIPVGNILSDCGILLIDEDHERWKEPELLRWVNEALAAILNRRPAAFAKTGIHSLIAGTRQNAPSGSAVLLDVVRNIGPDGETPGRVVRRTDRQLLDDIDPGWHTATPRAEIRQYTFDDRAPTVFYCWPPAIAGTKVEVLHAPVPDEVMTAADTIDIGIEYKEAIVNYVCYRCKLKDDEEGSAGQVATFYQAFNEALGIKGASMVTTSPNQPGNSV